MSSYLTSTHTMSHSINTPTFRHLTLKQQVFFLTGTVDQLIYNRSDRGFVSTASTTTGMFLQHTCYVNTYKYVTNRSACFRHTDSYRSAVSSRFTIRRFTVQVYIALDKTPPSPFANKNQLTAVALRFRL